MSAFLVSNHHVNALATFAADQSLTSDASEAALLLWRENAASLRGLYADADQWWPDLARLDQAFAYEDVTLPTLWHVLKAGRCYAYQSCEHAGWATSAACALNEGIMARAAQMLGLADHRCDSISRNGFYEDAPWGLEAEA